MVARSTAVVAVAVIGRMAAALSSGFPSTLISWQALNDAVAGQHAAIDREVPAHHKGTHGGVFLGQIVGFVCKIGLVLAAIDQNQASVAVHVVEAVVHGIHPPTAPAKALKVLHIKASHLVNCLSNGSIRVRQAEKSGTDGALEVLGEKPKPGRSSNEQTTKESKTKKAASGRDPDSCRCDAVEPNLGTMWYKAEK